MKKIRVLVVEDSPVVRQVLVHILESDPEIEVVATAKDGKEAVEKVCAVKPDIVTMDVHMPEMDGYEATKLIMSRRAVPILIVTGSSSKDDVASTFKAVEAGALAVVARPRAANGSEFITTVKLMSEVKVVTRLRTPQKRSLPSTLHDEVQGTPAPRPGIWIIAIGASTGGPIAIQKILAGLVADFHVPILIVQHLSQGFVGGFAEWLSTSTGFKTVVARHGEKVSAGIAYVAPDGSQMGLENCEKIVLSHATAEGGLAPSVSFMFRSILRECGANSAAVLLTGMGKDGAEELKALRDAGAVTIAQDEETSVVFGMPGEAIRLEGAKYILPLEMISGALKDVCARE